MLHQQVKSVLIKIEVNLLIKHSPIFSRSFECPKIINQDNGKCYYKNKVLVPGEILENFQQSDTCEAKCYCNLNRGGGPSEMLCTRLKCNEKPRDKSVKYCIKQYEHKSCCPVKSVCGKNQNVQKVKSVSCASIIFPRWWHQQASVLRVWGKALSGRWAYVSEKPLLQVFLREKLQQSHVGAGEQKLP